jgi:hypothetical protein
MLPAAASCSAWSELPGALPEPIVSDEPPEPCPPESDDPIDPDDPMEPDDPEESDEPWEPEPIDPDEPDDPDDPDASDDPAVGCTESSSCDPPVSDACAWAGGSPPPSDGVQLAVL